MPSGNSASPPSLTVIACRIWRPFTKRSCAGILLAPWVSRGPGGSHYDHHYHALQLKLFAGIPHAVMEDDMYEGFFIPKGSVVLGNLWWIFSTPVIGGRHKIISIFTGQSQTTLRIMKILLSLTQIASITSIAKTVRRSILMISRLDSAGGSVLAKTLQTPMCGYAWR